MPTRVEDFVEFSDNFMTVEGMKPFGGGRIQVWENITSDHVMTYWNENDFDVDVLVSRVVTVWQRQNAVGDQATKTFYSQNISYSFGSENGGLNETTKRELAVILASRPFIADFQRYANALYRAEVTDTFLLTLLEIHIDNDSSSSVSTGAVVGIILGIVAALGLMAGGVWYYKKQQREKDFEVDNVDIQEFVGNIPSSNDGMDVPQDVPQNIIESKGEMPLAPSAGGSSGDMMEPFSVAGQSYQGQENVSELSFHDVSPEYEGSGDGMEDEIKGVDEEDSYVGEEPPAPAFAMQISTIDDLEDMDLM